MLKIDYIKQNYPELFDELECPICGKKFYLSKNNIINKYRYLCRNGIAYIGCCKSHTVTLSLLIGGSPLSRQDIIKKSHRTKLNNIDENGLNSYQRANIKHEETCLKRYGKKRFAQTNNYKKKFKDKTYLEKSIKKHKETCRTKYGNENYTNRDKAKMTNIKTYGYYFTNREKAKRTYIKNMGVDNPFKSLEFKQKMKKLEQQIKLKRYNTMKLNKSFNKSKPEEQCYNLLLTKFNKEDIIRQYNNDLYPFNCDFYIKSLNLYIECHFHWTHGGEPFNKDNLKHLERLNLLKSKNTKFYKMAEKVWTYYDPLKLTTFKKNNLNYKIFYTEKEFEDWFNTL